MHEFRLQRKMRVGRPIAHGLYLTETFYWDPKRPDAAFMDRILSTYADPVIGDLPVQAIDTGLVLKMLEPMWATKPETASQLRDRIESTLDWAKIRGYRQGQSSACWRGHLD